MTLTGVSYKWNGPNNFSSLLLSPVKANIQFADSGTYTLISSLNGCNDTINSHIAVSLKPAHSQISNIGLY